MVFKKKRKEKEKQNFSCIPHTQQKKIEIYKNFQGNKMKISQICQERRLID